MGNNFYPYPYNNNNNNNFNSYSPYSNPLYQNPNPYGFPMNNPLPNINQNQNNNNFNPNKNNITPNFNTVMNTNKIYANGIEDAKNMKMPLNSDYIILDNDEALLYRKVVDSTGRTSVDVFDVIPHEEKPKEETKPIDETSFVSKSDFEKLKMEIEKLKNIVRTSFDLTASKDITGGDK